MEVRRTVPVALDVDSADVALLEDTRDTFLWAAQYVVDHAFQGEYVTTSKTTLDDETFDGIRLGNPPTRPLYTAQSVLSELATLALYKPGNRTATRALSSLRESESITISSVREPAFEIAGEQFDDDADRQISIVDHTTSILADEHGVEHIFAFDSDFRTLGFSPVPEAVTLSNK